jgi:hypothetical protein
MTTQTAEGFDVLLAADADRFTALHEWLHVARGSRGYGMGGGEEAWIDSFLNRHAGIFGLDQ